MPGIQKVPNKYRSRGDLTVLLIPMVEREQWAGWHLSEGEDDTTRPSFAWDTPSLYGAPSVLLVSQLQTVGRETDCGPLGADVGHYRTQVYYFIHQGVDIGKQHSTCLVAFGSLGRG